MEDRRTEVEFDLNFKRLISLLKTIIRKTKITSYFCDFFDTTN